MEEELDTYQIFYRSPRIQMQIEPFEINIDSPTAKDNREETPLMLVLGPSVLMGMASLGAAVYAFQYAMTNTGNLREREEAYEILRVAAKRFDVQLEERFFHIHLEVYGEHFLDVYAPIKE